MNRARLAINTQAENARLEIEAWKKLKALSDLGDVKGFYRAYASYLEERGIESDWRAIIHKMALAVVSS